MLALFLLATFAAAAVGGLFGPGSWYETLTKPSWNPPNWLFGPVWTMLYILIAVSGWLVWREGPSPQVRTALIVFAVQLVLNAAWSWLFFGLHRMEVALVEIVLLLGTIVVMILLFLPISRAAGMMLVPYALWVSFATVLNATLWRLNS